MTQSEWAPTRESFANLLRWLGGDRENGARAYETIRRRLVTLFLCRACPNAEDLADETINRVTRAITKEGFTYEGDPVRYFYGVARLVHLESLRRKPLVEQPVRDDTAEVERRHQCLDRCVEELPARSRRLALGYYQEQGKKRFTLRAKLASELGIPMSTLRVQAHRIRNVLRQCVSGCVTENEPRL